MMSRHSYTARKKLEVVECAEREGNCAASRKYPGLSETSIRNWRKLKSRLLTLNGSVRAERGRISAVPVVEKALLDWLEEVRLNGTTVDFVDLMLKARRIITDLSLPDCRNFKASRNWVYRFIKRNGLRPLLKMRADRGLSSKTWHEEISEISDEPKIKSDSSSVCIDHLVNRVDILEELRAREQFVCEYCGKSFATKSSLTTHLVMHTGEKPHKCNLCGNSYKFISSLMTHIGTHTKPYECETCGKGFSDPYLRKRHEKVHLKDRKTSSDHRPGPAGRSYNAFDKQYRCDICSKSFTTKNMLTRHFGVHSIDNGNTDKNASEKPGDEVVGLIAEGIEIKEELFETEEPVAKQSLDFYELINKVVALHDSAASRKISFDKTFANSELDGRVARTDDNGNDASKSELSGDARRLFKDLQRYDLVSQVKNGYQFKCYLCEKVFMKFHEFVTHIKSYVMDKIFSCNRCKKSFHSNSYLRTHNCRRRPKKRHKKVENKRLKCLKSFRCNFALKNHKRRSVEKACKPTEIKRRKTVDCNENLKNVTSLEQSVNAGDNSSSYVPSTEVENVDVVSDGVPSGLMETTAFADMLGEIGAAISAEDATLEQQNSLTCKVPSGEGNGKVSVREETLSKDHVELSKDSAVILETFECREESEPDRTLLPGCLTFLESAIEDRPGMKNALTKLSIENNPSEIFGSTDKISTQEKSPRPRNFWDDFKKNLAFENTKTSSILWPDLHGNEFTTKPRKKTFKVKSTRETRHECEECGKLFKLKSALKKHKCENRELSECVPDEWCRHSARIQEHRNSNRGKPSDHCCSPGADKDGKAADKSIHVCGICKKSFNSIPALKRHSQSKHPKPVKASPALPAVNQRKNILGRFATFFSTSCSVKTDVAANVSFFGLGSRLDRERNQLVKKVNENHPGRSFLFNYSYDERPYGCGLCHEVFRTKDKTLNHFVKCIELQ